MSQVSVPEQLAKEFGQYFHVPALLHPPAASLNTVYCASDPFEGYAGAPRLCRDVVTAASMNGQSEITLIGIVQDVSSGDADHFGVPRVVGQTQVRWPEPERQEEYVVGAQMLAEACEASPLAEEVSTWALVGSDLDPFVLTGEEDAFLLTRQRFERSSTAEDFDTRVFNSESWKNADFRALDATILHFDELSDDSFVRLELWRKLPSPAPLMRLREARILRPDLPASKILDLARSRYSTE